MTLDIYWGVKCCITRPSHRQYKLAKRNRRYRLSQSTQQEQNPFSLKPSHCGSRCTYVTAQSYNWSMLFIIQRYFSSLERFRKLWTKTYFEHLARRNGTRTVLRIKPCLFLILYWMFSIVFSKTESDVSVFYTVYTTPYTFSAYTHWMLSIFSSTKVTQPLTHYQPINMGDLTFIVVCYLCWPSYVCLAVFEKRTARQAINQVWVATTELKSSAVETRKMQKNN